MEQQTPPPIGLTALQEKAAQMLARGLRKKQVAEAIGREPQTISRWLREAPFRQRVEQLVEDEYRPAREKLRQKLPELVDVVLEIALGNEDDANPTRLKAALWAIERVWKEPDYGKDKPPAKQALEDFPVTNSELADLLRRGREKLDELEEEAV